jgi:hypothetical protein
MQLITQDQFTQLLINGCAARDAARAGLDFDPVPVVKLFTPDGYGRWLLTDIDPYDSDRAYGLCDLGSGFPELGYVSLRELEGLHTAHLLQVVPVPGFVVDKPISVYADEARKRGVLIF